MRMGKTQKNASIFPLYRDWEAVLQSIATDVNTSHVWKVGLPYVSVPEFKASSSLSFSYWGTSAETWDIALISLWLNLGE